MRRLILMRHAKAGWPAGIATDFDRPLTHIQSGDGSTQKTTDLILCYALHLGERRKRSNFWKFPPLLNESSQTAFI